jgi:hypothetical protein
MDIDPRRMLTLRDLVLDEAQKRLPPTPDAATTDRHLLDQTLLLLGHTPDSTGAHGGKQIDASVIAEPSGNPPRDGRYHEPLGAWPTDFPVEGAVGEFDSTEPDYLAPSALSSAFWADFALESSNTSAEAAEGADLGPDAPTTPFATDSSLGHLPGAPDLQALLDSLSSDALPDVPSVASPSLDFPTGVLPGSAGRRDQDMLPNYADRPGMGSAKQTAASGAGWGGGQLNIEVSLPDVSRIQNDLLSEADQRFQNAALQAAERLIDAKLSEQRTFDAARLAARNAAF